MAENREHPPGGTPPKGIDFQLLKAEQLAKLSAAIRVSKPDFSVIRSSEDYAKLTPEERHRLETRLAELSGEPVPVAPSEETAEPMTEATTGSDAGKAMANLRKAAELLKSVASKINVDPDYAVLRKNPDYAALSAEDRRNIDEELGIGGATVKTPRPQEDFPRVPEKDPVGLLPGTVETPERREDAAEARPLKRTFDRYRVMKDDTGVVLVEDFNEWDAETKRYVTRTIATDIPVPPDGHGRFAEAATAVRRDVDKKQVKLFFDRKGEDGGIRPKWKFTLDGRTREIHLTEHDLPEEIVSLVKERPKDYFRLPEWQRWFGPAMQARRESIIAETLAERFVPERKPEGERPAIDRAVPKEIDVSMAIETLIMSFAPLYDLPKDTPRLIDHITTFAKGVFEYRRERAHKPKEGELDADEMTIVYDALRAHFKDDPKMSEALEAALPDLRAPKETARQTAIRDAKSAEDLVAIMEALAVTAERGDAKEREAARQDMLDIEFGRAGEASELRMDGVVREGAAKAFFGEHPRLDRRNFERTGAGVTVHLDRLRTDASLARAMRAILHDAIPDTMNAQSADAAIAYFIRLVDGGNGSAAGDVFRKSVASLDRDTGAIAVKDYDRLVSAMRAAYESIDKGSR